MQELELTNFVLRGTKIIVVDGKAREQLEELNIAMEDKLNTSVFVITVDELRNAINNKQDIIIGVTQSELESLSGVTGNIQAQLNGKQSTVTGGASTGVNDNYTGSRALGTDSDGKIRVSSVTTTELDCLIGTTDNIQAQFRNKIDKALFETAFTIVSSGSSGSIPFIGYYKCVRGNTKHIEFNGQAIATKIPANTWTTIINLSREMYPIMQVYRTIMISGTIPVILQINTNGQIQAYSNVEVPAGYIVYDSVEYL